MTRNDFLRDTYIDTTLVNSVINAVGGWTEFKEKAEDIYQFGASGGVSGFIYYKDTLAFYGRNRKRIFKLLDEVAFSLGEDIVTTVSNFNGLRGEVSVLEVSATLHGSPEERCTCVANALAWFALEEVARNYCELGGW